MVATMTRPPKEFEDFLDTCDREGADPLTRMRRRAHERVDNLYDKMETKYHEGREGKSWADLASDVYDDVKKGYDELSKEAADWYYGNP